MSISIVLPAYKPQFLKSAIQSILAQTYSDFELIIVNDNPGSEIEEIVKCFEDKRIKYLENFENIGGKDLVKNWNICINYATKEYLVMASDDDIYERTYLDEMLALTKKYPNVDLYYCRIKYINDKDEIIQISQPALEFETQLDFIFQRLIWNRKQALQEFFFRTSKLKEIGGFVNFPLAWYTDDATLSLMASRGVAYSDKILFGMRMSGTNISSGNQHTFKKLQALKQYIHWLKDFLPILVPVNEEDRFMKDYLLKTYQSILNDYRLKDIRQLPFNVAIMEYKALVVDGAYSRMFINKQIVKKVLRLG